jgi:DNA-binding CsgD family transcriptional regulator
MERFQEQAAAKQNEMALLSPKQQKVYMLLCQGKQYKEMADEFGTSVNTVRSHLKAIYRKLKVRTRHDATRFFGKQGT